MANKTVEILLDQSGLSVLTVDLFQFGSDTRANGSGDTMTEATNRKGCYQATVTEAITGLFTCHIYDDGVLIKTGVTRFGSDAVGVYRIVPWTMADVIYLYGAESSASGLADFVADYVESGYLASGLTITPLVASVANPFYATRDLPVLPAASGNTIIWTITDGNGSAVDLSGKTCRLVAYTVTAVGDNENETYDDTVSSVAFQYATGGDGLTVGGTDNNQITLVHSITKTATAGNYRYFLWNITDNTLLAKGRMPIEPSVKGS